MPVASSEALERSSQYRIAKTRVLATLTLSNGTAVSGSFFVSDESRTRRGPEGVKDVLNAEDGFFPFEATEAGEVRTRLYNRTHIVFVQLTDRSEPTHDPGYDITPQRAVSMLMSNGARLRGAVRVACLPEGRDRLSDFARSDERFRYLEAQDATYIINVRHLVELAEETVAS